MATLQQVIELVFEGVDHTSNTITGLDTKLSGFGDKLTGFAQPFANVADGILKIDTVLAGLGITMGAISVNEAAKFEGSLLDLQKQLGEGEGKAADYAAALEKLAIKYGTNANDLVKSAADFKAAGFNIETSINLVNQSLELMIAGGLSAEKSTEILKSSLAGFQVPADKTTESAQRIADVLNKVADISQGGFGDLAQGFSELAPIAKLTGLSFEELASVLSVVIDKGYTGSETATALQSAFLSLVTPSKEAAAVMETLGVQFNAVGQPIGNVRDILTTMIPKWDQLTESQKLYTASTIAGKEQAGKFVALLDDWKLAMDRTKIANEQAGGSIEKEVTLRLQSAEVQFKSLGEASRQLAVSLGSELLDSTKNAAGGLSALVQSFKDVVDSGALDPLLDLVKVQADNLGILFTSISKNLPKAFENVDFSGIVTAFGDLGKEIQSFFKALFGEIDLTTVEGLSSALQTVINTGEVLIRTTEGIIKAFEPFAEAIGNTVRNFNQLDAASNVNFGEFIGSMKAIVDAGPAIAAALISIGKSGIDMAAVLDFAFGTAKVGINILQVAFDVAAMGIVGPIALIAKGMLSLAEVSGTANSEFAGQLKDIIAVFEGIKENADRNSRELQQGFQQAFGSGSEELGKLRIKLQETENGLRNFGQAAKDSGTATRQAVTDYDGILAKLNQISPVAKSAEISLDSVKKVAQEGLIIKGDFSFDDQPIQNLKKTWDEKGNPVFTAIGNASIKATGAFAAVGDAAKKTGTDLKTAAKDSEQFKIKMEEIASNERIKNIEFAVNFNIAKLQTDSERVKATFSSLDNTITSTGDLLSDLFGAFNAAETGLDKLKIESYIRDEMRRRQEALDLQKKLAEAEIERINAQARSLDRGDALITIEGNGLKPELEAFMWKILELIRVRVSAEFQQYLLGVGAA